MPDSSRIEPVAAPVVQDNGWHHYAIRRQAPGPYKLEFFVDGKKTHPKTWAQLKLYSRTWWHYLRLEVRFREGYPSILDPRAGWTFQLWARELEQWGMFGQMRDIVLMSRLSTEEEIYHDAKG